MGTGEILIVIGAIVIAFSSVTAVGAISGKIEGVITLSERLGITAFLMILFVMGCASDDSLVQELVNRGYELVKG